MLRDALLYGALAFLASMLGAAYVSAVRKHERDN